MADAFTIIAAGFLGGIGMGLAQKIVEYYWENKLKHRMIKIDNASKAVTKEVRETGFWWVDALKKDKQKKEGEK